MKLTDYDLIRLETRAADAMRRGYTVRKPVYVDWLGRCAMKFNRPTEESLAKVREWDEMWSRPFDYPERIG